MKSRISDCTGKLQWSFHIHKIVGKFGAEYNRVLNLKRKLLRNYMVLYLRFVFTLRFFKAIAINLMSL